MIRAAAFGAAVLLAAAAASPSSTPARLGVQCSAWTPPGTAPDPADVQTSYQASDVGKPGVPKLGGSDRDLLRKIQHYVHSKTLRIAFLDNERDHRRMIVFDAVQGPCMDDAPGYHVLNGACNEYYEPGETPRWTHGIPSCDITPPPWPITNF